MVFHSSHRQRFEFVHPGNPGHVRPEFFLEVGWNQNPPQFGSKDAMGHEAVISVRHGAELYILVRGIEIPRCASRPLRGLHSLFRFPAVETAGYYEPSLRDWGLVAYQ